MNYNWSKLGLTVAIILRRVRKRPSEGRCAYLYVSLHSKNDHLPVSARKFFKKRRHGALTKAPIRKHRELQTLMNSNEVPGNSVPLKYFNRCVT